MIRINDINKSNELSGSKGAKKTTGGPSFSSFLNETMASRQQQVGGVGNISVTDAIFAAQMVNDEEEREIRKKLVKRGNQLLDKLEDIRDGLLMGYMSMDKLIELSRMIKEKQFETNDERLKDIIAEIELRVEVELAKLTK
mgnify:CR=1 FL=1